MSDVFALTFAADLHGRYFFVELFVRLTIKKTNKKVISHSLGEI